MAKSNPFQLARTFCPANGEIEVRFAEVDIGITADNGKAQLRVLSPESGETRPKPCGEEIARTGNGVHMAGLTSLHRLHAFFEMEKTCADCIETGSRLVRQFQTFGGATEQDHA